jgi:hypothetical protein
VSRIRLTLLDLNTATARALAGCADRPGVAVITVRPDTRREAWLARDLLSAAGIRHSRSGQTRRDADDRQLAPMWLHAHDIRDVLVVGVEALPAKLLPELVELTALAAARLWLVTDHVLPDTLTDTLADWPVTPCAPDDFTRRWLTGAAIDQPSEARQPLSPAGDGLPADVPQVDFAVFRATARRQLPAEEFAAVDARYLDVLEAALQALDDGSYPVEVLRDALSRCASTTATTVTTRAVQAAAFRAGHHLRASLESLLACEDHAPVAAADDAATWRQLHTYRQPFRQASCALTLLGLPLATQRALRMADLDVDTPALRIDGCWRELPAAARPTLRALQLSRLAAGASDRDPLLARMDGQPVTERSLADAATAVRQETGLRLMSGRVEREHIPTDRWARSRGVQATTLEV